MNLEKDNRGLDSTLREVRVSVNNNEPLALMHFGDFSLLMSSKDIVTLMSAHKIIPAAIAHSCGAIEFEQQVVPVFAFNKALKLQPTLSNTQMTLVIIQYDAYIFALCCTALEKIEVADVHFFAVPLSMSSRKQPFTQLAVVNKRAAGLTSAALLWELLHMRHAAQTIPRMKSHELIQGAC